MGTEFETIKDAALLVRRSIEPALVLRTDGPPSSRGFCLYGSILAATILTRFDFGVATVRGGDGERDGGAVDIAGRLRGHYWIELEAVDGQRYIIDVTADQFGHPPVRVMSVDEASRTGQYCPGNQTLVDDHVSDAKQQLSAYASTAVA